MDSKSVRGRRGSEAARAEAEIQQAVAREGFECSRERRRHVIEVDGLASKL